MSTVASNKLDGDPMPTTTATAIDPEFIRVSSFNNRENIRVNGCRVALDSGEYDKILVINTGGTISSEPTDGQLLAGNSLGNFALRYPEFQKGTDGGCFDWEKHVDVHSLDPCIDSSEISSKDWRCILTIMQERAYAYRGVVIAHGTDSLAFSAAVLAFCLNSYDGPVILTGSMVSMYYGGSDGCGNLFGACVLAYHGGTGRQQMYRDRVITPFVGVYVYFNHKLLYATRIQKMSAGGMNAFRCGNSALAGYFAGEFVLDPTIEKQNDSKKVLDLPRRVKTGPFTRNVDIQMVLVHPGMSCNVNFQKGCERKGIVIVAYGSGNGPLCLRNKIKYWIRNGIFVVVAVSAHEGGVSTDYAVTLDVLDDENAHFYISARDMTKEAAYGKLLYLLSSSKYCHGKYRGKSARSFEDDVIKRCMQLSLARELSHDNNDEDSVREFHGKCPTV